MMRRANAKDKRRAEGYHCNVCRVDGDVRASLGRTNQVAARRLYRGVDLAVLFADELGPINRTTFDAWHANAVEAMIDREPRLTVGWATKILNVYLKTRVYIGSQGRHHLKEMIHPPIDAGLWLGLERRFPNRPDILDRTHCVRRIKDIVDYECYHRIIDGCRSAAKTLDCELIEVEQLWAGTEFVASALTTAASDGGSRSRR